MIGTIPYTLLNYFFFYVRVFHLEYDVVRDEYTRVSNNSEVTKEWKKGVSECEDIQRKVELDWGQVYLARKGEAFNSALNFLRMFNRSTITFQRVPLNLP